ncbi:HAD family hydrolase [Enterococcus sp. AZ072]|uniref:HAD family hydrolase n=1 Tax=unclassified Enterococcus TaxID=2608891 RepID=UPI003D26C57F
MTFKAVIFDMDGVIVDTEPLQFARQKEYLQHLGVAIPEETLMEMVGGNKKMTFQIISNYYKEEISFKEYYKRFAAYYADRPIDFTEILNEGVIETLEWLKAQGYRLALASSGAPEKIEAALTQCKIKDYFELILSGDMFKASKPHPEIYQTVAQKMRLAPEECLVIEDSNYGIESATRAGMYTLAKREERFPFSQEQADGLFDSFSEVIAFLENQVLKAAN